MHAVGEIGDIETLVTFHSNGTPHFWMSFFVNIFVLFKFVDLHHVMYMNLTY